MTGFDFEGRKHALLSLRQVYIPNTEIISSSTQFWTNVLVKILTTVTYKLVDSPH